jgi:hypothetical protein
VLRKKENRLLVGLVVLLSILITNCATSTSPKTYSLSGTLTRNDASNGRFGYVKLVALGGAGDAPALYWAKSSPFFSHTATYALTNIAEGSYTGWAFIDMDGDATGDSTSMPDKDNDVATDGGGDFTIDRDQVVNLIDTDWIFTGS